MGPRERNDDDLLRLAGMVRGSREADRYPPHWPEDPGGFVASPSELAAFVFEAQGKALGHVALHASTTRSISDIARRATGLEASRLAAVARLFVDGAQRRSGIGRQLLDAASAASLALGRQPILDVWCELDTAIAFYESCGWWRAGEAVITFGSSCSERCVHAGRGITSYIFVGPALKPPGRPRGVVHETLHGRNAGGSADLAAE